MSSNFPVPETRVLAIASHVVYGYVGNTMATFVLQALGCEVAAINTVHFSNHTGYRQFKGTRASADEIREVYDGLRQSYLTDFDMLLSGYAPNAEAVEAIGFIARDLRYKAVTNPGSFFWVLDPVMGDRGRLYVNENVVPVYKALARDADLILPNQFEAETLSGVTISSVSAVCSAISSLHKMYSIPHIIVTSIHLNDESSLSVIGSSARSDGSPRLFQIKVPKLECFFSGTGDMFAALTVVRLREACAQAGILGVNSWRSQDDVSAVDLPLAKATEKVLSSMQTVLQRTMTARDEELAKGSNRRRMSVGVDVDAVEGSNGEGKRRHLAETKAAEVRLVRNVKYLKEPEDRYHASALEV